MNTPFSATVQRPKSASGRNWPVVGMAAIFCGVVGVFGPRGFAPAAVLAAILLVIAEWKSCDWRRLCLYPPALTVLGLLAYMLTSSVWAIKSADAISTLHGLGPLLLSGALMVMVAQQSRTARLVNEATLIVAGFAALMLFILFETVSDGAITTFLFDRGILLRPWELATTNRPLALFCFLGWAGTIILWQRGRGLLAAICLAATFATCFSGILLTARIAMLSGIAVCLILILAGERLGAKLVRIMTVLLVALVLAMPLVPHLLPDPELVKHWLPDLRFSGIHRFYIWQFAAERVAEHPLLGWGLDASRSMPGGGGIVPGYLEDTVFMPLHPHNGIMQVWVELGLVGALFLATIFVFIIRAIRRSGANWSAQAAGLGAFVTGLVLFSAAFGAWQGWWVGSMALGAGWITVALRQPVGPPSSLVPGAQVV